MPAKPARITVEFRCAECGYGIMISGEIPTCPMCRASAWQTPEAALTPGAKRMAELAERSEALEAPCI